MSGLLAQLRVLVTRAIQFCGGLCQHRARLERAPTQPVERPAEPASDTESEFSVVLGTAAEETVVVSPTYIAVRSVDQPLPALQLPWTREQQLLAATTAAELAALFPAELAYYRDRRIGENARPARAWTLEARASRAFRAGVAAHRVLQGLDRYPVKTPGISAANTIYIVLRWRGVPVDWWCRSYAIYSYHLKSPGRLQAGSISHAFPTEAEAELYLIGAQRRWPLELVRDN